MKTLIALTLFAALPLMAQGPHRHGAPMPPHHAHPGMPHQVKPAPAPHAHPGMPHHGQPAMPQHHGKPAMPPHHGQPDTSPHHGQTLPPHHGQPMPPHHGQPMPPHHGKPAVPKKPQPIIPENGGLKYDSSDGSNGIIVEGKAQEGHTPSSGISLGGRAAYIPNPDTTKRLGNGEKK